MPKMKDEDKKQQFQECFIDYEDEDSLEGWLELRRKVLHNGHYIYSMTASVN